MIDPLDGLLFVTKYSFNILIDQDARILVVGCMDSVSRKYLLKLQESPILQKISYRLPDCSNNKLIQKKICSTYQNLMGLLQ